MNSAKNYIQKHSSVLFTSLFSITLIGLLFSRALLSISNGLWLLLAILLFNKQQLRENKQLAYWSIAPLLIFIGGAWQAIASKDTYDYLLSLITYPIAAFSIISLKINIVEQLKKIWVFIAIASFIIPLVSFFSNINKSVYQYSMGQVVYTPMDTDHVRYSIFLVLGLMLLFATTNWLNKYKNILIILLSFFILFLAVRTGWLGLLIIAIFLITQQLIKNLKKAFLLIAGFVVLALIAYIVFPQIKQKVNYTFYDWQINPQRVYNANYSDAARFSINQISYNIIKENKLIQVGWANIPSTLETAFQKKYPTKKLIFHWPFNQYLFWYLGSGLLGFILFSLWILYPIVVGFYNKNYILIACQLFIITTCFFESTLSLQFGIFLHAWSVAILFKKEIFAH